MMEFWSFFQFCFWGPLKLLRPLKKDPTLDSWPLTMPLKTRPWIRLVLKKCPVSTYQVLTTEWVEFQLSICWLVSQFQVLVFFAIAEYGLLLHTKSHRSKTYEISPQQPNDKHGCIKIGKKKFSMPLLDKIAIVVLPLLFIMFNVIYWSVYTTWIPYARHHKPLLIWSRFRI